MVGKQIILKNRVSIHITICVVFCALFLSFFQIVYATEVSTENNTKTQVVTETVPDRFVISLTATNNEIVTNLFNQGYNIDRTSLLISLSKKKVPITPGAYKLTKAMTQQQILSILSKKPYMKWVVIPEGLRKEEIADLLAKTLGWTTAQKIKWIKTYTQMKVGYIEGVYFPDTYLIPITETPLAVANRLIAKFNEKFTSYLPQFTAENIQWTTGLTIASIVQREAANDRDMPLIAGIILNRLKQHMTLNVDATLQYIRGNKGKGWWAPITIADKKTDSPYNTYKRAGLPPHPIANPGIPAIEAVLHPATTDCLYYLHDHDKITHCAITYEEHQGNIEKYLKTSVSSSLPK